MTEVQPHFQAFYDHLSAGPGIEVLNWKCPHMSVYSAIHYYEPVVPQEIIDQAQADLLAYYQVVQTCDCAPVIIGP